jgi:hypothetical protein
MALPKPGDYITAKCRRCDDITGHVVMLVLDGQIAKIECKACGSVHKYREARLPGVLPPKVGAVRHVRAGESRENSKIIAPASASFRHQSESPSQPARPKRPASAAKLESAWQEAMVRHSAEIPKPYSMSTSFAAQDFIDHAVFGRGEVLNVSPPDKMNVLFQDGMKTLRCKA